MTRFPTTITLCRECGCEVVRGRCKNPECACHWQTLTRDRVLPTKINGRTTRPAML